MAGRQRLVRFYRGMVDWSAVCRNYAAALLIHEARRRARIIGVATDQLVW